MRREPVLAPVRGWRRLRDAWLVLSGQANALRKAGPGDDPARTGCWIPRGAWPFTVTVTSGDTAASTMTQFSSLNDD